VSAGKKPFVDQLGPLSGLRGYMVGYGMGGGIDRIAFRGVGSKMNCLLLATLDSLLDLEPVLCNTT
jgi:hypothetical protein